MPEILLINPNSAQSTTDMMVRIARQHLPAGWPVVGCTAAVGPAMIVNETEMAQAAEEVARSWQRLDTARWAGVIVSAYGDPGIDFIRACTPVPVVGICEASLRAAACYGRFGIATVTPQLAALIRRQVEALGLAAQYSGIRLTAPEPRQLAADADALTQALLEAAWTCVLQDRAQAVIIGGGPLGQAALRLQAQLPVPVIAPITAAADQLRHALGMPALSM